MPDIHLIMLTISEEDSDLFDAVRYGASGYLLKNTNVEDLMQMLTDVENGEASLSRELAFRLLKEFRQKNMKTARGRKGKTKPGYFPRDSWKFWKW